jgi:hypothetical protein
MSTTFISQNVWPQLTRAVRATKQPCDVAVAYFGTGAPKLLPLPKRSRLVVDASDRAVGSGQTNPSDLLVMMRRGVQVFTVPNLHAKVYVLGKGIYLGSANVSNHSANQLLETLLHSTDPAVSASARKYVRSLCLHELTPTLIARLIKLYRPPHVPGGKRHKAAVDMTANRAALPRLFLVQLVPLQFTDRDQVLHATALKIAKKRRKKPRSYELESFRWSGRFRFKTDDVIIQITDEGTGSPKATPPGNVRYIRSRKDTKGKISFVFLERPAAKRRKNVKQLAKKLGRGFGTLLTRSGMVREYAQAKALLGAWR